MSERITGLHLNRVAFVGAGDNPEAHVVLWKAKPEDKGPARKGAVPKRDARLTSRRVSQLKEAWDALGAVIGEASREEDTVPEEKVQKFELPEDASDELRAYVEGLETRATSAETELKAKAEADKDVEPDPDAEIAKALAEVPQVVRDALAKAQADADASRTESAEVKAEIDALTEKTENAEEIAKAAERKYLRADADKIGPMMRRLRKVDPELADEVDVALNAANAIASESLTEIGKGAGSEAPTEAFTRLKALAVEKAKAEGISEAEAFTKVLSTDEGKELHRAAEKEKEASER